MGTVGYPCASPSILMLFFSKLFDALPFSTELLIDFANLFYPTHVGVLCMKPQLLLLSGFSL